MTRLEWTDFLCWDFFWLITFPLLLAFGPMIIHMLLVS